MGAGALTATDVALIFREAMYHSAHESERSLQAKDFRLGVSDLGGCRERVRRMVLQMPPDEPDRHYLPSFVGTAIGAHLERALLDLHPTWIMEQEIETTLPSVNGNPPRVIIGHADVIVPEWNAVLDIKTKNGLGLVQRAPTRQNYLFQRAIYALGAIQAGLIQAEGALVGNVYVDRGGDDEMPHVDLEPFSMSVVDEAAEWLDDVLYAVINQEEASKDWPIEACAEYCPWYLSCRALDRRIEGGLITDEDHLTAIKVYTEAQREEKEAARRKAAAKRALMGVSGSDGTHAVKWVEVAESYVSASVRPAYRRLSITPVRRTDAP